MEMMRTKPNRRLRMARSALIALGLVIGITTMAAGPAKADHVRHAFRHHVERVAASHFALAGELFFGPPIPVPVPVPVHVYHEVVYPPPPPVFFVDHGHHGHHPPRWGHHHDRGHRGHHGHHGRHGRH
jgi:hypothetical protein